MGTVINKFSYKACELVVNAQMVGLTQQVRVANEKEVTVLQFSTFLFLNIYMLLEEEWV